MLLHIDKSKEDIENNEDTDDKDEQSMTEVQKQQNIRLNKIRKRNPTQRITIIIIKIQRIQSLN
jgi:hypothetical protein